MAGALVDEAVLGIVALALLLAWSVWREWVR